MPRHSRGGTEKSKDFKGSMIKIITSLKLWYTGIIISLVLAFISAILALIAPNKLSDLADSITNGITPRITKEKITEIMNNPNISYEDKQSLMNIMANVSKETDNTELLLSKLKSFNLSFKLLICSSNNERNILKKEFILLISSIFFFAKFCNIANSSFNFNFSSIN